MKIYTYLLLATLSGCYLPTYSQCRDCEDANKPKQPTSLTFSSGGTLISSVPTVITCESSLTVFVMDKTLNEPTRIQKKLQQAIKNKAPKCLESNFDDAVTNANKQRGMYNTKVDDHKKNTYSIGNASQQNLPDSEHDLGGVSFPKPGKKSFKLTKKNADNTFFKEQFDTKPTYKGWNDYKPIVERLYPTYSRYAATISQLDLDIKALESSSECCDKTGKALLSDIKNSRCLYLDPIQDTQTQLCKIAYKVIDINKCWMNYWLWYTEGEPLLNPFGVVSPAEADEKIDRELASAEAVLRLYNALSDKCCESSSIKDILDTLKPAISELTNDLVKLRQLKEKAPTRQKQYEEWLKSTAQTEAVINEVVLYATDCPQINWMTHYDAQANYIAMQPDGLLPELVFEKDALRGLVHNIPAGRKVSAKEVVKEAKLRTEIDLQTDDFASTFTQALISSNAITSLLDRIRGTLNTIRGISSSQEIITEAQTAGGQESLFKSGRKKTAELDTRQKEIINVLKDIIFPKYIKRSRNRVTMLSNTAQKKLQILNRVQAQFKRYEAELNEKLKQKIFQASPVSEREFFDAVESLKEEVKQGTEVATIQATAKSECDERLSFFKTSRQLIDWLMAQTEPPIADLQAAYDDFEKKKATQEPALRSEDVLINESRTAKGTNDISYDIFEAGKDKPVASGSYKTYNTVRFWPSVSINYVFGSRAVSIFDNATGQFRTDTEVDNFEAVVGVKWYPGPSNVTRTSKRTKFIRNTLSSKYNQLRGNSLLGKVFVTGGLGVTHKFLRNYFLGAGLDIVPGFSIQGGGNLFFRKGYDLDNGQIRREYDVPAGRWFFGLAIDPNVVTKLLSIF